MCARRAGAPTKRWHRCDSPACNSAPISDSARCRAEATDMNYSVEQHIELRRLGEIAAAPDGTWLAVTVQRLDRERGRYVADLWKVAIDGPAPVQLTRGDSRDGSPCFRRDGSLAFLSNRQPNELKPEDDADQRLQVWLLPAQGGEPVQITDEPLGVLSFRFARAADR